MIILKTVNFGSRKTGLSTVGYTLVNADGTTKQARTTTGVSEQGSTGIYYCDIAFDNDWRGYVLWDTGEATPLYAAEDFDYREYDDEGYPSVVVDNIWTKEEKKKFIDKVEEIIRMIGENRNLQVTILENLQGQLQGILDAINNISFKENTERIINGIEILKIDLLGLLKTIDEKTAPKVGTLINEVKDNITECILKIEKIPIAKEVNLRPIKETITVLSKQIEFSIKMAAKNMKTEDLEALLKEGGIDVSGLSIKRVQD